MAASKSSRFCLTCSAWKLPIPHHQERLPPARPVPRLRFSSLPPPPPPSPRNPPLRLRHPRPLTHLTTTTITSITVPTISSAPLTATGPRWPGFTDRALDLRPHPVIGARPHPPPSIIPRRRSSRSSMPTLIIFTILEVRFRPCFQTLLDGLTSLLILKIEKRSAITV